MVCIDTDILIDVLRNDAQGKSLIQALEQNSIDMKTTTINSFELLKGAHQSKKQGAREGAINLLSTFNILEFDYNSSEKAAEIHEELRKKGLLLDPLDILIAAIVIANNETLLTRNTKHFERIPGLKLEALPRTNK